MDTAELGMKIDSSTAVEAKKDLKELEDQAVRTESAMRRLEKSSQGPWPNNPNQGPWGARDPSRHDNEKLAKLANEATEAFKRESGAVSMLGRVAREAGAQVSRMNLLYLAISGVATAYGFYQSVVDMGRVNLEETLKEQEKITKGITDAFKEAAGASSEYYRAHADVALIQSLQSIQALQISINQKAQEMLSQVSRQRDTGLSDMGDQPGAPNLGVVATGQYAPFQKAIEDFNASMLAGVADAVTFRAEVARIALSMKDANPEIIAIANSLNQMASEVANAYQALEKGEAAKRVLEGIGTAADRALLGLKALPDPMLDVANGLEKLLKMNPEANKSALRQIELQRANAIRNEALAKNLLNADNSLQYEQNRTAIIQAHSNAIKKITEDEKERANALDKTITSISRNVAALEADARATDATVGQKARLRAEAQMLEVAFQNNIKITDEYEKKIQSLADRMGQATQKSAELRLESDIMFERQHLFSADSDKNIESRLRSVYGDVQGPQRDFYRQQMQINEALRQTGDISRDAFKGFTQDIMRGVSATEALSNMLNKVASKLVDMAVDQLWSKALGGFTSSLFGGMGSAMGGGVGSSMGGMNSSGMLIYGPGFHGGGVVGGEPTFRRLMPLDAFTHAPRFASGLNKSAFGINEVPIVAHKGEVVGWPEQMQEAFGGNSVNVNYSPVYNVEGSGPEINALRAQMTRDRAEAPAIIVNEINKAKTQRRL